MKSSFLLPLIALCLPLGAQGVIRVEFTEVLADPVGPNAGAQVVEVRGSGNVAADFNGWYLVTPAGSYAMPAVVMPHDGIALLHLGQSGTSTPTDLYLPSVPTLTASDSLALFRSAAVTNPADLVDFVAWGGGQGAIATAVLAGQWPSALSSITSTVPEGQTLAHYDDVSYGNRSRPESWFVDGTPTLGLANDGGGIFAGGYGCPQVAYAPQIGSGAENNRPWLGESWRLDVGNLPPVSTWIFVAFGLDSIGSLALDPYGITGCFFEVDPMAVLTRLMPPSYGTIVTQLPANAAFVGLELRLQGVVPVAGANAAGVLVTRELLAYLGSR
ncbi:MAG: hypothetical protein KDC98_08280 [Planctomycetes bacterium]|nr:hypothetical protein [Planctomycetota bacterium]